MNKVCETPTATQRVTRYIGSTHKLITVSVWMFLNVFCGSSLYLKSPSIGMNCLLSVCVCMCEREREREIITQMGT